MKTFTGFDYLLIDAANNAQGDLDKETFEERIDWASRNLAGLEAFAHKTEWKERPLYLKAVMAIRSAQRGEPTGHLVGFDAVCSGMQIMSVLTGCVDGARATGLVDPDRRADAYTDVTTKMASILGNVVDVARKKVKNAVMTALYASKKEPEKEFGKDSPELDGFWKALYAVAPGACELLEELLSSWQPYALAHSWKLPDGFTAHVKVMQSVEHRIEVDELNHSTFEYTYLTNLGERRGVKNPANIIHSVDGYILRSLIRRCSYDRERVEYVESIITRERLARSMAPHRSINSDDEGLNYYLEQYERSGMADVVIIPHLDDYTISFLTLDHLVELHHIVNTMLHHQPFDIIAVHDEFKCHPNNMNHLRSHYRDILAELADSDLLSDLLSQVNGVEGTYEKLTPDLSKYIRQSNYSLS